MAITGIDHIVMRVANLATAITSFEKLGLTLTRRTENEHVGKVAFFELADGFFFEIVEPLTPDSPIGQALAKRGEGIHSVALAVDDLAATKAQLSAAGNVVIDGGPLPIAFLHPKATHGAMLQLNEPKPR